MTYMPKRGDDDIWARVKEGDVHAVEAFSAANKQTLDRRKTNKTLIAQIKHQGTSEQWFDKKFSHGRRRRDSVCRVVADELQNTGAPLHEVDVEQLAALNTAGVVRQKNITTKSTLSTIIAAASAASQSPMKKRKIKLKSGLEKKKLRSMLRKLEVHSGSTRKQMIAGTLFDHIFVRPKAPRELVLKYEKHNHLLPMLRSMGKAHSNGETNVATHMRNATILTKAYKKLQEIDPNDLLESYADRKKIIGVAEAYIEEVDVMKQYADRVSKNKRTSDNITQALMDLELRTHALAGPERYQCFHSKFRPPRMPVPRRNRKRKKKKKKKKAGGQLAMLRSRNAPESRKHFNGNEEVQKAAEQPRK